VISFNLPRGFRASGVSAGLKSSGAQDLALVVNDGPQSFAAAVFTSNQVQAAPVLWSQQVLKGSEVKAVLLNSGGANACTGADGFLDTHKSAERVAHELNISASEVAICSTGMIGLRLPMEKILLGIANAVKELSENGLYGAAEAIKTTDTVAKISSLVHQGITITGFAKGAGMLAPSLATMLVVIMTDAKIDAFDDAQLIFSEVVDRTFNRIDSDGCTSTNDTVLFMASGASDKGLSKEQFHKFLSEICQDLSEQLIADAEGHSKIVSITTINAETERDALEVSRSCARNNLLKCAIAGEDPNWGRILASIGSTKAAMNPENIDVSINGVEVCRSSQPGQSRSLVNMKSKKVEIVINLNLGREKATILTNDLTAEYVHENSAYST
jgi:glutamate N-acetyltransferase/amino-acid N-acetyltransferase